jgi:hypothetical protein
MELAQFAVGGLGGVIFTTLWTWFTGARREEQKFRAAALLVRDEIRANIVRNEIALQAEEMPDGLQSQTYQDLQVILASRMKNPDLDEVRAAYIHVRVPRALEFRVMQLGPRPEWVDVEPLTDIIQVALDSCRRAYGVLGKHATKGAAEV